MTLSIWIVYNRPENWPHRYVAKRFERDEQGQHATGDLLICKRKDELRALLIDRGVARIISSKDELGTFEVWF